MIQVDRKLDDIHTSLFWIFEVSIRGGSPKFVRARDCLSKLVKIRVCSRVCRIFNRIFFQNKYLVSQCEEKIKLWCMKGFFF